MPHDESPCHIRQTPLEKQRLKYLPISSSPGFPLFFSACLYIPSHSTHSTHTDHTHVLTLGLVLHNFLDLYRLVIS
jgi:hypothetical protein